MFNIGNFAGSVTQGWREVDSTEKYALVLGGGAGNNPGTILDTPITVDRFNRVSKTTVDTPFTNGYVTWQPMSRLRVIGNISRFDASSDGFEDETAAGSFGSFGLRRFFTGLSEQVTSRAENTTWRGGARTEFALHPKVDLLAGYQHESREISGTALIESLYLQSITFGGTDKRDLEELLNTESSIDRDQDTFDIGVASRDLGPFALRATYRTTKQDVTIAPDIAEIVIPGPEQGGDFQRTINTIDVSGTFAKNGFMLGAAVRRDDADDSILRTDYHSRNRYRLRGGYSFPRNLARIGLTAEQTHQENDAAGTGYDGKIRQYSGDLEVQAIPDRIRLRAAYSKFDVDSDILIRRPENFAIEHSIFSEDGHSIEGGVIVTMAPVTIEASMTKYKNEGSNPFQLDRASARLSYDFFKNVGVAAEFARDDYSEMLLPIADYEADRFGLYLRWHQ
jgi:hypothetical protein